MEKTKNPAAGLRQRLRDETRPFHNALEARLPLARGLLSERHYRDHLSFLLGFYAPLEQRLQAVAGLDEVVSSLNARWKTKRLESDLALAASTSSRACRMEVDLMHRDEAIGALYVLEGATLGARVLLPRLRRAGVLPGATGSRYLDAYGNDAGRMWESFCTNLQALPQAAGPGVINGAVDTFRNLLQWRKRWERHA